MEHKTIFQRLTQQQPIDNALIEELKNNIGADDKKTKEILDTLLLYKNKSAQFLKIGFLLLLENIDFNSTIALLASVLENCSLQEKIGFLMELAKSIYYIHRLAIPYLVRLVWFKDIELKELILQVENNSPIYQSNQNISFQELKHLIKICLEDEVELVVKTTVLCLAHNLKCIFTDEEIKDFCDKITQKSYNLEPLVVNFKILTNENDIPLDSLKTRMNLAKLSIYFENLDTKTLALDKEDDVRIVLSEKLKDLKNPEQVLPLLMKDQNVVVKSNVVEYFCTKELQIPHEFLSEDWEVKSTLLKNWKDTQNVDLIIPVIITLCNNPNWRIRKSVLITCGKIIKENCNLPLIQKIFYNFANDKVHDIRKTFGDLICELKVPEEELYKILKNTNFRYRKVVLKYAIEKKNFGLLNEFKRDINEIKIELLDVIMCKEFDEEYNLLVKEIGQSADNEVREKVNEYELRFATNENLCRD